MVDPARAERDARVGAASPGCSASTSARSLPLRLLHQRAGSRARPERRPVPTASAPPTRHQGRRHRRVQQRDRAGRRRCRRLELRAVHARAHPPAHRVLHADDRSPDSSSITGAATCRPSRPSSSSSIPLLASHIYISSVDEAKAERAIEPESIALGVFGLIAALAALLIAGQVIGRQLRAGADDLDVLRALGAGPGDDDRRRTHRRHRRDRRRRAARGRGRRRALAALADRPGAERVSLARHRVRLDRARPRRRWPSIVVLGAIAVGLAYRPGAASRRPPLRDRYAAQLASRRGAAAASALPAPGGDRACASRSSPGAAAARCRSVPRFSAPRSRSSWS